MDKDLIEDKKLFVYYFDICIKNLLSFIEKYKFEQNLINDVIKIKLNWKNAIDSYLINNDNNYDLNNLMLLTKDLYQKIGLEINNKIKSNELIYNNDIKRFRFEYTLIMRSIINYLSF